MRKKITDKMRLDWLLDSLSMTIRETSRREIDAAIRARDAGGEK